MKKIVLALTLAFTLMNHAIAGDYVEYGLSLTDATSVSSGFELQGYNTKIVSGPYCLRSSTGDGPNCLIANKGDRFFAIYGLTAEEAADGISLFQYDHYEVEEVSTAQCLRPVGELGSYCVIAESPRHHQETSEAK